MFNPTPGSNSPRTIRPASATWRRGTFARLAIADQVFSGRPWITRPAWVRIADAGPAPRRP